MKSYRPWERIFYGEFDGKRKKRLLVKIIGNEGERDEPPCASKHQ